MIQFERFKGLVVTPRGHKAVCLFQDKNNRRALANSHQKESNTRRGGRRLESDKNRQQNQPPSFSRPSGPYPSHSGAFNVSEHKLVGNQFTWVVDSGATSHITSHKEYLTNYIEFTVDHPVYVADGRSLMALGKGTMPFRSGHFKGTLTDVLWVPEMNSNINLFSLTHAMKSDCDVEFNHEEGEVLFLRKEVTVLIGTKSPGSSYFLLDLMPNLDQANEIESAFIGASIEEWHKRLSHCSVDAVKALIKSNAVDGLKISNQMAPECAACTMGKICRTNHPTRNQIKANERTAVLHLDTVGPLRKQSIGGSRFFVLATEEYSGYKLFETLGSKANAPDAVKRIINQAELDSGRPVKAIVSDNGLEFTNSNLEQWIRQRGTIHMLSVTYTPQQNGRAERANRTILDGMRTLLNDSGLPEELWAEALNTTVYTTNRLLSSTVSDKTRYELLTGRKPDLGNLRIFGQKAIIREDDRNREGKLAPRGQEVTFVGYTERFNSYRFYTETPIQQVFIACDVKFINNTTETHKISKPDEATISIHLDHDDDATVIDESSHESTDSQQSSDVDSQQTEINESHYMTSKEGGATDETDTDSATDIEDTLIQRSPKQAIEERPTFEPRMTRARSQACSNDTGPSVIGTHDSAMFTLYDEPTSVNDAKESPDWSKWKQAMEEEIQALRRNNTWTLVPRPQNKRTVKNKWVFKAKLKPDGKIDRYKARLVAKGFSQIPNIDFKETYAPVASMNTIRLFLAVANQKQLDIVQFDIKTAFLYGELEEELYMEQPEEYSTDQNKVCKLNKSLYGLKQAPRQWNRKFDAFLKEFKLQQSEIDKCFYFNHEKTLLLIIYVDDGLAAGENKTLLKNLVSQLEHNFDLKVMECESYLGIDISRDIEAKSLGISQSKYVDKILTRFDMADCKPVSTPEAVGAVLDQSQMLPQDNQFKELVGSLLYLSTCTRPDISHAVSIASRTSKPTQAHWIALKRILRYLKGSRDLGIRFKWEKNCELTAFSDADYANDTESRRSTTGFCIYFGGGLVAWRCQRQPIITLSTTEAEYVAGCELVKELLPIRQQLIELGQIDQNIPTKLFIDNQSACKIATNEGGQNRTKHIDIREKWLTVNF